MKLLIIELIFFFATFIPANTASITLSILFIPSLDKSTLIEIKSDFKYSFTL